jgi:carbon-monoxide dehydrogenase small subunit
MIMAALPLLDRDSPPSDAEIRTQISGNLCRCTGYANIVKAIALAGDRVRAARPGTGDAAAPEDDRGGEPVDSLDA